jgi:hypothetical protein
MTSLAHLRRIAELEFADIVVQTDIVGVKLRVLLTPRFNYQVQVTTGS